MMSKTWRIISIIFTFILFVTAGTIGKKCGGETVREVSSKNKGFTPEESRSINFLSEISAGLNKETPRMIDKETQLYKTLARQGELIYQYIMVNYPAAYYNSNQRISNFKPILRSKTCNSRLKSFLENGVSITYQYYGKDRKHIATFTITPADCGY